MVSQAPPATFYNFPGQITELQSAPATWEEKDLNVRKSGWDRKTSLSPNLMKKGSGP